MTAIAPDGADFVTLSAAEECALTPADAEKLAISAVHNVTIGVGRAVLRVRFSRARAAALFSARFSETLSTAEPTMTLHAVATDDRAYFWVEPDRAYRWNGVTPNHLLVFFADGLLMQEYFRRSDALGIHAAVVAKGGRVAALVGSSTAGKSTTAVACVANGFSLYSDERCIIDEGRVVPFFRAISVREGGRAALLADATTAAIDSRLRTVAAAGPVAISPRQLCGDLAGGDSRKLDAIFSVEGRQAVPSVEPAMPLDLLPTLLRSAVCRQDGIDRAVRLLTALRGVTCYRLLLGAPGATARAIAAVLDES